MKIKIDVISADEIKCRYFRKKLSNKDLTLNIQELSRFNCNNFKYGKIFKKI